MANRVFTSLLIFLLIFSAFVVKVGGAEDCFRRDVELFISEGYKVASIHFLAEGERGPALLLLHMLNRNQTDRELYIEILKESRVKSILAVDLRGHGDSDMRIIKNGDSVVTQKISWRSFTEDDFKDTVNDLEIAWAHLKASPSTDTSRMGVMGVSMGASYAAIFAASHPEVKTLIMLSPGVVYRGVECLTAVEKYGKKPVLFVASRDDLYSSNSCRKLKAISPGSPAKSEIFDSNAHGTDLIDRNPAFEHLLTEWIKSTL